MTFFSLISCEESSTKTSEITVSAKRVHLKQSEDSIRIFQSLMNHSISEDSLQTLQLLTKRKEFLGAYRVEFGYTAYNEDKYGFKNPGFLKVYKNNKMIFSDVFLGHNDLTFYNLGKHHVNGNKLFFILNWGLEACDYTQTSRFYCISPDDKIHKLGDHWSMSTGDGYSSRSFEYFFTHYQHDKPNNLVVVESLFFHEHDQKDISDTIVYTFEGDKFKVNKLSNHLKSAN